MSTEPMPMPARKVASQPTAEPVTVAVIEEALRLRYSEPEWVLLTEVRHHALERQADVVAVSTWQSRGCLIVGVEIKVRRPDWLAELRNPEKAEAFAGLVDQWWIAAPRGVVELSELPPAWGLMELPSTGRPPLRMTRAPGTSRKSRSEARRDALDAPVARAWLARLLQRTVVEAERRNKARKEQVNDLASRLQMAERNASVSGRERDELRAKRLRLDEVERQLRAAEQLLGVPAAEIEAAASGAGLGHLRFALQHAAEQLRRLLKHGRRSAAALDELLRCAGVAAPGRPEGDDADSRQDQEA